MEASIATSVLASALLRLSWIICISLTSGWPATTSTIAPSGPEWAKAETQCMGGWFAGRASLWATFEIRSGASEQKQGSVLGFDESFLRPFTRAVIEAATTRTAYRISMVGDTGSSNVLRIVEYVTEPGTALREIVVTPYDNVMLIGACLADGQGEKTLFQLPRTDSFLRAFVGMAYRADETLRDTLIDMERIARQRSATLLSPPAS